MGWKRKLLKASPTPVEGALNTVYQRFRDFIPLPYRHGREFRAMHAFLQESQWWSLEELKQYQRTQLEKLLTHAYHNVPYYRKVFDQRGLKPQDICDFDDLRKLPYLTKEIVRENLQDLIAKNISPDEMQYVTTGGSTGAPLGLYIEKRTNRLRLAFEWREFNWMGYHFGDRCVVLRGNVVDRADGGQSAWWEYDRGNNYLVLSAYDMEEENLPHYVRMMEEFQPKVIRAYPSAIEILARFLGANDLQINKRGYLQAISTSSETLYPHQREIVEGVFGCPVFDKYGNSEQVTILGECERHEGYHDFMEYSYTEILDKDGEQVTKEGEVGEIVGTSFTNYAVPLIRYKTQDLVEYTSEVCSCGRALPLVKRLEGRTQGLIVTKRGNLISLGPLLFGIHDSHWTRIKQLQFVQQKRGDLTLKVVKDMSFSEEDVRSYILHLLRQRKLDTICNLRIEFVEDIPLTSSGKHRFLIQELPIEFGHDLDTRETGSLARSDR